MSLRLLTLALAAAVMPAAAGAQDYTIAFARFGPLNSDIFIADREGAGAVPFLPHPGLDYNPSFSPDLLTCRHVDARQKTFAPPPGIAF